MICVRIIFSKLPVRQESNNVSSSISNTFSKLPVRQESLTVSFFCIFYISKLPVRQESASNAIAVGA